MKNELLTRLLQRIDEPAARFSVLDHYYHGTQPLSFLSNEAREALDNRFGRMATNIPRLAVTAMAERLRITGFLTEGRKDTEIWSDWVNNDLDQLAGVAHREALTLGASYVLVWSRPDGRPQITIESAKQVAVERDPATRAITAAVKRWSTKTTTEAVLYEADTITRYRSNTTGATTTGFHAIDTIKNPLGRPPVVALTNGDRILEDGVSEIDDLMPLVDALNKILADMMVTSEYVGRPRRWAAGIEVEEDENGNPVNPYPEGNRMMLSEDAETRFGQLDPADLSGYEAAVRILLGQIMAVSALPSHYVGVFTNTPPSADALRAAEASLTARVESRQSQFGRGWEDVARLATAVRTGRDPESINVRVQWAEAATRSVAQEADAIVKLHGAGLLPASVALRRLGYTDDELTEIRTARREERLDLSTAEITARADLAKQLTTNHGMSQPAALAAAGLFAAANETRVDGGNTNV